jgi:hypothetical protein
VTGAYVTPLSSWDMADLYVFPWRSYLEPGAMRYCRATETDRRTVPRYPHYIDAPPDDQRHESTWVNRAWSPSKERSR